jgi:hypothetical protein
MQLSTTRTWSWLEEPVTRYLGVISYLSAVPVPSARAAVGRRVRDAIAFAVSGAAAVSHRERVVVIEKPALRLKPCFAADAINPTAAQPREARILESIRRLPLTTLNAYRVYYAAETSSPCPGSAFVTVSNSQSADAIVAFALSGLAENATYYVSVTAVDTNGNESRCSVVAFAPARPSSVEATAFVAAVSGAGNTQVAGAQGARRWCSTRNRSRARTAAHSQPIVRAGRSSRTGISWPSRARLALGLEPGGGQANRREGQPWTDNQWAEIVVGPGFMGTRDELFAGLRAVDVSPAGGAYGGGFTTKGYQILRWDPEGTSRSLVRRSR